MNEPNADEWKDVATRLRVELREMRETNLRLHQLLAEASNMHTTDLRRLAEVAAFLDRKAREFSTMGFDHDAADCRAWVERLRGQS